MKKIFSMVCLVTAIAAEATASTSVILPPVPCVTENFTRVFRPEGTRYLNDHTLIQGNDGQWHVYGITDSSPGNPWAERNFLHAQATSLNGPWTEQPDILDISEAPGSIAVWAPYAFRSSPDMISLVFYEGYSGGRPSRLRRADAVIVNPYLNSYFDLFSDFFPTFLIDPNRFRRISPSEGTFVNMPGGRDPMLLQRNDFRGRAQAILYSVGNEANPVRGYPNDQRRGQILASVAGDGIGLDLWQPTTPIITDPIPNYGWGNLESPFVVEHAGYYFLFLTRTGEGGPGVDRIEEPGSSPNLKDFTAPGQYMRTLVFRSTNPLHFDWQPVAGFRSHASEIVNDNGHLFITSGGWTNAIGESRRGLLMAPLEFRPEGTCPAL